jgi:4-diphosphocytidyl-2-C-methyl-D-erythritol kinase
MRQSRRALDAGTPTPHRSAVKPETTPAQTVRVRAPAKLNLFLHVGDRRPDGYHALESLVAFAAESDLLECVAAPELSLQVSGPFARALGDTGDNLVLRAARALQSERGAALTLRKNLPVAAGLGGGSADAAAALRGLNALWHLGRSEAELLEIAAELGSDVPACVLSRPLWMEGRGEKVTAVPTLPPIKLVLVNPGFMVPTKAVFGTLNARSGIGSMYRPPASLVTVWDLVTYLADAGNDLEGPASLIAPDIDHVLGALAHEPGCVHAQMSGSGATCFGLFQEGPWAAGAAERLALDHPHWWVHASYIAPPDFGAPERVD